MSAIMATPSLAILNLLFSDCYNPPHKTDPAVCKHSNPTKFDLYYYTDAGILIKNNGFPIINVYCSRAVCILIYNCEPLEFTKMK